MYSSFSFSLHYIFYVIRDSINIKSTSFYIWQIKNIYNRGIDSCIKTILSDGTKIFIAEMDSTLEDSKTKSTGIIRLSSIRSIMERGKHALLDITPNAVDRLNYAQFYPIVIFMKADSKHIIKQLRSGLPK